MINDFLGWPRIFKSPEQLKTEKKEKLKKSRILLGALLAGLTFDYIYKRNRGVE